MALVHCLETCRYLSYSAGSEMLINFPISVLLASSVGLRKSTYMSRIPFGAGYIVAFVLCT